MQKLTKHKSCTIKIKCTLCKKFRILINRPLPLKHNHKLVMLPKLECMSKISLNIFLVFQIWEIFF